MSFNTATDTNKYAKPYRLIPEEEKNVLPRKRLVSLKLNLGKYHEFLETLSDMAHSGESSYVCVANVHMLVEGYLKRSFAGVVNNGNIVTPDGLPLTWALRLLYGIRQERVAGMDLLPDMLQLAEKEQIPVYFLGGSSLLLTKAKEYLGDRYPTLPMAGFYSPPFRDLSGTELDLIAEEIKNSGARFVFIVLGCPKQEKFMADMKGKIPAVMIGVGGALSVMIGVKKRAPKWMRTTGFEWLYRWMQEPRRLFKRYAVSNSVFIMVIARVFISRKLSQTTKVNKHRHPKTPAAN